MKTAYQLIQDLEDGVISPNEHKRLMELLRQDADLRKLYLQHMQLVGMLQETAETKDKLGTLQTNASSLHKERKKNALRALSFGLAACLLLGICAYFYQINLPKDARLVGIESSDDAKLTVTRNTPKSPHLEPGDAITIDQGLIKLAFPSGVEALVEGPSDIKILTPSEIQMQGGQAWFKVPEKGRGFSVHTKGLKVIDLGTQFGIRFKSRDVLEVHVAEGHVRVEPKLQHVSPTELTAGHAKSFDAYARSEDTLPHFDQFRRVFSKAPLYLHWNFDTLNDQRFASSGSLPDANTYPAHIKHLQSPTPHPISVAGKFGNAFSMRGDGTYADTNYPGIAGNTPRTIAFWARHREGKMHHGIRIPYLAWGNRNTETSAAWRIVLQGKNEVNLMTSSVGTSATTPLPPQQSWFHIASVYTGKTTPEGTPEIFHYLNGQRVPVETTEHKRPVNTDTSSPESLPLRFGYSIQKGFTGGTVNADIDEVYLIRAVLEDQQIQYLMQHNAFPPPTP
ncbi:LamG-like jellyroll fold domain-containing protein [Rubritalea tangerina]|uniref:LamG-like jellyroll fold domain-containing protein n=1 Tax=Rubritalea tangerina TaxID=430798 RepID=A0ABW4ZAJ0_9BACT